MVLFNYSTKELTAKIVYYGPGLCGKTTNLQYIHGNLPGSVKGKMLSLATKTDRTLFFDFLPIDLGKIRGMQTRVQLYTVPGQVFYNETRKLVLKGADGLVFVADSQEQMLSANAESFKNLEENLKGHGLTLAETPHVIQFNKRDLPNLAAIDQLNATVNKYNAPFYESIATTGIGVQDTLKAITKLVLLHLTKKYDPRIAAPKKAPAAAATPPSPQVPVQPVQMPAPGLDETQAIPLAPVHPPAAVPPSVAVAAPSVVQPEPLPAPAPAVPVEAVAPATIEPAVPVQPAALNEAAPAAGAVFEDNEIDVLVNEVEDVQESAAPLPIEAPDTVVFQIDESNVVREEPVEDTPEWSPTDAAAEQAQDEVVLTDVASDQALFEEPGLDVTAVNPGEQREIVIPVELGEGCGKRRFKLSILLRLDAVD